MNLRPYQSDAVAAVLREWEERAATLIVMATGLGKTVCFSHITDAMIQHGRVMVLAHREELITQAAAKIKAVTGQQPEIEMASSWADRDMFSRSRVVVSSIQTQISGESDKGRMTRFNPLDFSAVIIDECHHAAAESYKKVIAHYMQNPGLKVLGVTATPDRGDQVALGSVFESCAFTYDIAQGVRDGWLVPIKQRSVDVEALDLSNVRTTAGDLNGRDLAEAMDNEKVLHEIAHPTIEIVGQRKTLVFSDSVAHAERLAEIFNRHRADSAAWVCGETDKEIRRKMLADYAAGKFQFLVNVGCLTEGFDDPTIKVVCVARPTKSRALYAQMIGRGTRVLPGLVEHLATPEERAAAIIASDKPDVEVIDFKGNAGRHKLICTADILGGKESADVVARASKSAQQSDEPVDMLKELDKAKKAIADEHALSEKRRIAREAEEARKKAEAAKRRNIRMKAQYRSEFIDPMNQWDVRAERSHEARSSNAATDKQIRYARHLGVDVSSMTKTQASAAINQAKYKADAKKRPAPALEELEMF